MKPFIGSGEKTPAQVLFYPPTNRVVITDYSLNVEKMIKIIKSLDVPTATNIIVKVFTLEYAQASDMIKIIEKIKNGLMADKRKRRRNYYSYTRSRSSNTPAKPDEADKNEDVNIISVSDDKRTNSIIVTGNQSGVNRVKEVIAKLDTERKTSGGIHVYKVKHSTATELADTINNVIGNGVQSPSKSKTAKANIPQVKSPNVVTPTIKPQQSAGTAQSFKDIRIIPEENTNSLIIVSNEINYETIKALLDKLDVSRNQVFVKAIIMEINAERANDWKIANYYLPKEGGEVARIGYGLGSLAEMATEKEGATLFFPLVFIFR